MVYLAALTHLYSGRMTEQSASNGNNVAEHVSAWDAIRAKTLRSGTRPGSALNALFAHYRLARCSGKNCIIYFALCAAAAPRR